VALGILKGASVENGRVEGFENQVLAPGSGKLAGVPCGVSPLDVPEAFAEVLVLAR
jgi:hypothetical protein